MNCIADGKQADMIQPVLNALSVNVFDCGKMDPAKGIDGIHLDDVHMVQFGHGPCFAKESFDEIFLLREFLRKRFQCHNTVEADLSGKIHFSHPALAETLLQFKVAKLLDAAFRRWCSLILLFVCHNNSSPKHSL